MKTAFAELVEAAGVEPANAIRNNRTRNHLQACKPRMTNTLPSGSAVRENHRRVWQSISVMLLAWCFLCQTVAAAPSPSVTLVTSSATPGGPIAFVVANGPGHHLDWVGLYNATAPDVGNYLQYQFLNGTQMPTTGIASASLAFTAPMSAGAYQVRFFAGGGYTRLAVSNTINVAGSAPGSSVGKILFNGDSNTAHYYEIGPTNWTERAAAGLGYATVVNLAVSGKASAGVLADVPEMNAHAADLCMVMIGTNDMEQAVTADTPAEEARLAYLQNMRQIIGGMKLGCGRVAVLSPIFVMRPREVALLGSWVDGLRTLCVEFGVAFIDVFTYMKDLSATQTAQAFDALFRVPGVDFYHLSTAGHAMLADFVVRSGKLTP